MKKLYRSCNYRMLGGVCGGLAEYFDIDPVVVRLLWVLAVIMGGAGIPAYIIAWIIIPEEPGGVDFPGNEVSRKFNRSPEKKSTGAKTEGAPVVGMILVIFGSLFLIKEFFPFWIWGRFWPLIVIAAGILVMVRGPREHNQAAKHTQPAGQQPDEGAENGTAAKGGDEK